MILNSKKALEISLLLLLLGLGVLFIFRSNPYEGAILPCPLYVTTGLYCPGCGMTRAFNRLLHGDVRGALEFNPLIFLLIVLIIGAPFLSKHKSFEKGLLIILLILVIGFGVLRNIDANLQP